MDVGSVRVGVAMCDPNGILATPLATLQRDTRNNSDISELARLVLEHGAVGVVIGLPRTLAGAEGTSAAMAREYGQLLTDAISPTPIAYVDERLTTVSATRKLGQSANIGRSRATRGARAKREVIDQAAAVELLQHWLESSR
ncbi:MAG TPA: Holliday junction resolvase RuvX [Jatrophihabitans sp.]